jgi:hypothetical protein
MRPTERVQMAHRAAGQAIAEMVCADNQMTELDAAKLIAGAAYAVVRLKVGSEKAAEALYAHADVMVGTPG